MRGLTIMIVRRALARVAWFGGFHSNGGLCSQGSLSRLLSDGFCLGLAELPNGDFGLVLDGDRVSPQVSYRSDLWGQLRGPGELRLGAKLLFTLGPTYYEAIRDGSPQQNTLPIRDGYLTVPLQERSADGRIVEWIEVSIENN